MKLYTQLDRVAILTARVNQDWTVLQMAERADLGPTKLIDALAGRGGLALDEAVRLAAVLGVDAASIIVGDPYVPTRKSPWRHADWTPRGASASGTDAKSSLTSPTNVAEAPLAEAPQPIPTGGNRDTNDAPYMPRP